MNINTGIDRSKEGIVMKNALRTLIAILITVVTGTPCFSASYYIDYVSGDDSNNGSPSVTPFRFCPFDDRFSGSCTPAAGDSFYFKRGVVYEADVSDGDNNLIEITTGGSSNSTRVTFGAYGSGDRPVIVGGKQLDESRFSVYSGSVYRATNSSLGLTGVNVSGIFEADKYDTFHPRADYYDEEGSVGAVNIPTVFHQSGLGATDYVYIYTSTGLSPVGMDLCATWAERVFYAPSADFFTFENLVIQGASLYGISAAGTGVSSGYNLIIDNTRIGWVRNGVLCNNAPAWVKGNSRFVYCMTAKGENGTFLLVGTSDRASLVEDSQFIRTRNGIRFYGSATYVPVVRRSLFLSLLKWNDDWYNGAHTGIIINGSGGSIRVYRCIFYNQGSDFIREEVSMGLMEIYNCTIFEDRPYKYGGLGIQYNYTPLPSLNFKNNLIVQREAITCSTYASEDPDWDQSDIDYNYYITDPSLRVWHLDGGSEEFELLSEFQAYSTNADQSPANPSSGMKDANSVMVDWTGVALTDEFASVTYGNANFLKPKSTAGWVDAGTVLNIDENWRDYSGNVVTGAYDIGAFEYMGTQSDDEEPEAPQNLLVVEP